MEAHAPHIVMVTVNKAVLLPVETVVKDVEVVALVIVMDVPLTAKEPAKEIAQTLVKAVLVLVVQVAQLAVVHHAQVDATQPVDFLA